MASASITLKITPEEFDTLRQSLQSTYNGCRRLAKDSSLTPGAREAHRTRASAVADILARFNGTPTKPQ